MVELERQKINKTTNAQHGFAAIGVEGELESWFCTLKFSY